jgi:hypothetical protein
MTVQKTPKPSKATYQNEIEDVAKVYLKRLFSFIDIINQNIMSQIPQSTSVVVRYYLMP